MVFLIGFMFLYISWFCFFCVFFSYFCRYFFSLFTTDLEYPEWEGILCWIVLESPQNLISISMSQIFWPIALEKRLRSFYSALHWLYTSSYDTSRVGSEHVFFLELLMWWFPFVISLFLRSLPKIWLEGSSLGSKCWFLGHRATCARKASATFGRRGTRLKSCSEGWPSWATRLAFVSQTLVVVSCNQVISCYIRYHVTFHVNGTRILHPAWRCRNAKDRKLFFQLSGSRSENCRRSQPLERRFPIHPIRFFGKGRREFYCNKTASRGWIEITQQD